MGYRPPFRGRWGRGRRRVNVENVVTIESTGVGAVWRDSSRHAGFPSGPLGAPWRVASRCRRPTGRTGTAGACSPPPQEILASRAENVKHCGALRRVACYGMRRQGRGSGPFRPLPGPPAHQGDTRGHTRGRTRAGGHARGGGGTVSVSRRRSRSRREGQREGCRHPPAPGPVAARPLI